MRASVVQMNSTGDRDLNLEAAERLVRAAAGEGAELVVLPEKWPLLSTGEELVEGSEPIDGPAVSAARNWARDLGVNLQAGSFTEDLADQALPSNTALMINGEGEITATYRKIHMFDVDVGGVEYRESSYEQAGDELTVTIAGQAEVGMTICYDLRFPELFRALLDRGADTFTVPSAFTSTTGRDHWGTLVRARAIENQSFVLAANQVGQAAPQFDSWGHSLIADPWGDVIAGLEGGEGIATADLDFDSLNQIRGKLPAIDHRRPELFQPAEDQS
ncbi:MAG: carbon-nitrogen hydrolase family protein [Solirubrobacterales bacterium]